LSSPADMAIFAVTHWFCNALQVASRNILV